MIKNKVSLPKNYILLPVKTETSETEIVKEYVDVLPDNKKQEVLENTYEYRVSRINIKMILAYYSMEKEPNKTLVKLITNQDIEVNITQETIDELIRRSNISICNLWGLLL